MIMGVDASAVSADVLPLLPRIPGRLRWRGMRGTGGSAVADRALESPRIAAGCCLAPPDLLALFKLDFDDSASAGSSDPGGSMKELARRMACDRGRLREG